MVFDGLCVDPRIRHSEVGNRGAGVESFHKGLTLRSAERESKLRFTRLAPGRLAEAETCTPLSTMLPFSVLSLGNKLTNDIGESMAKTSLISSHPFQGPCLMWLWGKTLVP